MEYGRGNDPAIGVRSSSRRHAEAKEGKRTCHGRDVSRAPDDDECVLRAREIVVVVVVVVVNLSRTLDRVLVQVSFKNLVGRRRLVRGLVVPST